LRGYLESPDIEVETLNSFFCKTTAELGAITEDQVVELARRTVTPRSKSLFVACSQLPTLNAEVRAISAVQSVPYVLTTRNPAVKTIADFSAADRIAVPTVKISGQAMALQMAAAKLWGFEKYDKLDEFTVTMGHPDAMQAVLSGQTVNSHFTVAPFNYYELRVLGIHKVLNSYETDGKHTNGIQVTTKAFHDANPRICDAVRAAHEEANAFIKREPKAAAEIYLRLTNDRKNSADDLMAMVTDPDIEYTTAPANLMKHVAFMHKVGRLKHLPASWKDMFFAEAHDLRGSSVRHQTRSDPDQESGLTGYLPLSFRKAGWARLPQNPARRSILSPFRGGPNASTCPGAAPARVSYETHDDLRRRRI
jgi:ABC-type nitrate/sulfonate/bicarbonate transport system substrate-binding protein